MMLPHLATRLYNTPLLIQRAKLDAILTVLGDRVGWPETQVLVPAPAARSVPDLSSLQAGAQMGIALIPVYGSLVKRSLGVDAASGLTSYADVSRQIDSALADPGIQGILLEVDSSGGEGGGVFELGERIRLANAVKPVWAMASDLAFSAAYALACSASRLYVSRTGGVGSIGVIALHVDQSVRDAQNGYRFTAIFAGDRKNDFSPHAPLSDAAAATLQAEVDRLYGLFVGHVAAMRGLSEDDVRATQAGMFFGPDAVRSGLADAEGSLENTLIEFGDFLTTRRVTVLTGAPPIFNAHVPILEKAQMNASDLPENTDQPATAAETNGQENPKPAEPTNHAKNAESVGEPTPPSASPKPSDEENEQPSNVETAVATARADALAIAELCQLAGHSQRIAGFLAEGMNPDQVRQRLLAIRAETPEIASRIHPDAQGQAASPEHGPLMKAVRRMIGQ